MTRLEAVKKDSKNKIIYRGEYIDVRCCDCGNYTGMHFSYIADIGENIARCQPCIKEAIAKDKL